MRRWACLADITPIITAADGIRLYMGRDSRLANREQRRALRAIYRYCAIPGCRVGFDYCAIHHLIWYRNLGNTDIDNLLPICSKHHHLVHEGGWKLALDTHRNLTMTLPGRHHHDHRPTHKAGPMRTATWVRAQRTARENGTTRDKGDAKARAKLRPRGTSPLQVVAVHVGGALEKPMR